MVAPSMQIELPETAFEPIGRVLAPEEYDALPENPRRELVDGVIQMAASPTMLHQIVKRGVENELAAVCPDDLFVLSEIEVRLAPLRRRIPDVLAVRAETLHDTTSQLAPDQVVLVAEVW